MYGACADVDRKYAAHVGAQLLRICATVDRDVITGSDARTFTG